MRKLYLLILSFVVIFLSLVYLSVYKPSSNQFEAIYQSYGYVYQKDKRMELDLYSKDNSSIMENTKINTYFLTYENNKSVLNNVVISKTKHIDYYIYKVSFDIITPIGDILIMKDACLIIENENYYMSINVGTISILNKEIEQFNYTDIYASYTYMNGALMLVGINIEFDKPYNRISNLTINNITYTDTNFILEGKMYENEINIKSIIPDYRYNSIVRSHKKIESQTLFIPVTYKELIVVKGGYIIITFDGVEYLINEFDFIFNNLNIYEYKDYIRESINAKT